MCCLGAGVESMTHGYGSRALPTVSDTVLENQESADCLIPMGITSENVAKDYNVSRQVQDEFAAKSYQKAAAAQVSLIHSCLRLLGHDVCPFEESRSLQI
jgi:acetyl-CoA acyltransferase 1